MAEPVILGIDIGGTKSAVLIGTASGEILYRLGEETRASERTPYEILGRLAEMAKEALHTTGVSLLDVKGVGISCEVLSIARPA